MDTDTDKDYSEHVEGEQYWNARCMSAEAALRACRDSIQGYKDTNPLNPESVLAKALIKAKVHFYDFNVLSSL